MSVASVQRESSSQLSDTDQLFVKLVVEAPLLVIDSFERALRAAETIGRHRPVIRSKITGEIRASAAWNLTQWVSLLQAAHLLREGSVGAFNDLFPRLLKSKASKLIVGQKDSLLGLFSKLARVAGLQLCSYCGVLWPPNAILNRGFCPSPAPCRKNYLNRNQTYDAKILWVMADPSHPIIPVGEIAERCARKKSRVYHSLRRLQRQGKVYEITDGCWCLGKGPD